MEITTVGRKNDTAFMNKYNELLDILYGTDGTGGSTGTNPRLPMPAEIIQMFGALSNNVNPAG
jgi:hypothetical protein